MKWPEPQMIKFYVGQNMFRVDGRIQQMDAAPFMENGRAYVPVRFLAMALGIPGDRIIWNPSARVVTMVKGETTLSLAPGGNIMTVNDRSIHMDVAPQLRGGRVYLPARFVAEALGYGVEWDAGEQSVAIGPPRETPGTAFARMNVGLYPGDSPVELSSPGRLQAGQRVMVGEKKPPWALVEAGPARGWIPLWYLVGKESDSLKEITPYNMVVKEQAPVYLYPVKGAPPVRDLDSGKVVKVEYEYGPWRYVNIVVYDIPAVLRGWVPGEFLAPPGETAPMEGNIPKGARVYFGDPNAADTAGMPGEVTNHPIIVRVIHEKGEMLYVSAAGGWSAWVHKRDIIFNPFDV